jgi:hypothetical protein
VSSWRAEQVACRDEWPAIMGAECGSKRRIPEFSLDDDDDDGNGSLLPTVTKGVAPCTDGVE